jgi:Phage protein Gp19/Gp15/Gp42
VSTYAHVQDVESGWDRRFTVQEIEKVQALLDRAERMVELRINIPARILLGLTTPENVKDAIVEMVRRVLRNPGGYRQQATGPFSATLDRAVASGRLEIKTEERRLLGMISGSGSVAVSDPALPGLLVSERIDPG